MVNKHSVIEFIESNLVFPRRAGLGLYKKPVKLLPWQKGLIREVWNPQGKLLKDTIFISSCRKTGKSSLVAMLLCYLLFKNKDAFQEIPLLAGSFEQAKIGIYKILSEFLAVSKYASDSRIRKDRIELINNDSNSYVCSINENTLPGTQPTCVVNDELARCDSDKPLKNLTDGNLLSDDQLTFLLTNPCDLKLDHFSYGYLKLAEKEAKNPKSKWAVRIFQADQKDDIFKLKTWERANPNFQNKHYRPKLLRKYKTESELAKQNTLAETHFRRMFCGQWVTTDYSKWIDGTLWKQKQKDDYGFVAWGCDLALNKDRSALTIAEQTEDGGYYFRTKYYLPKPALEKYKARRRDETIEWAKEGWIELQDSEVLDQDQILEDIKQIVSKAQRVGPFHFDPACGAVSLANKIAQLGIETKAMPPYPRHMAPLVNELSRVNDGKIFYYDGNPVLLSDFRNTLLTSRQSRGYRTITRSSDKCSIDGAISSLLSVHSFLNSPEGDMDFYCI